MSGVAIGGIVGHSICTAIAVIGGRMVAQRISARTGTKFISIIFSFVAKQVILYVYNIPHFQVGCISAVLQYFVFNKLICAKN